MSPIVFSWYCHYFELASCEALEDTRPRAPQAAQLLHRLAYCQLSIRLNLQIIKKRPFGYALAQV
jgi:hypothetical protein